MIKGALAMVWLVLMILAGIIFLIGIVGIFENLVMGDPDEWIPVGTMVNDTLFLTLAILTFKQLAKK